VVITSSGVRVSVFEVLVMLHMSFTPVLTTGISLTKDIRSEQRPSWRCQLRAKIRVSMTVQWFVSVDVFVHDSRPLEPSTPDTTNL
jgi:hypothetical protein